MVHNREELYYGEEINLYDLVDILLRYKKKIMTIVVLGIILSFGGALIARKFRTQDTFQEYRIQYEELENDYYYQLVGLNYIKFDIRDILQGEKYIDRFLAIPELKELYEKQKSDNPKLELYNKRKFINEIMKVENVEGYDKLIVTLYSELDVASEMIDIYFEILQEEIPDKLKFLLSQTKESALTTNANAVERLNDIKKQLSEVLITDSFKANNMQDLDFLVSLKYPLLISNKNLYQSIYSKSSQQITGIDIVLREGKIGNLIEKKGSMVVERSKSKALLVLLGGTIFSVILAFMFVVISEMLESYKKHQEERKVIEHK